MSIFEYRKPTEIEHPRDQLVALRTTLARIEAEPEQTPRLADLKRILAGRIAELERKSA